MKSLFFFPSHHRVRLNALPFLLSLSLSQSKRIPAQRIHQAERSWKENISGIGNGQSFVILLTSCSHSLVWEGPLYIKASDPMHVLHLYNKWLVTQEERVWQFYFGQIYYLNPYLLAKGYLALLRKMCIHLILKTLSFKHWNKVIFHLNVPRKTSFFLILRFVFAP